MEKKMHENDFVHLWWFLFVGGGGGGWLLLASVCLQVPTWVPPSPCFFHGFSADCALMTVFVCRCPTAPPTTSAFLVRGWRPACISPSTPTTLAMSFCTVRECRFTPAHWNWPTRTGRRSGQSGVTAVAAAAVRILCCHGPVIFWVVLCPQDCTGEGDQPFFFFFFSSSALFMLLMWSVSLWLFKGCGEYICL